MFICILPKFNLLCFLSLMGKGHVIQSHERPGQRAKCDPRARLRLLGFWLMSPGIAVLPLFSSQRDQSQASGAGRGERFILL